MKEIYGVDITIWIEDGVNGATTDLEYPVGEDAINISYRNGVHYDAVVPINSAPSLSPYGANDCDQKDTLLHTEPTEGNLTPPATSKNNSAGKLKIIFWNSNGWEQERCDKIAEAALEEEADIICIQDARMHPARDGHMKGYEKRLERVTEKKWKGKVINRPEKTKGCLIGGSILFTSHNCADVRRSGVIKYGIMDKINLSWMRERINIISTYKPYPHKAKGSLLSAVTEGGECFEDRYWESLITAAGNGNVVLGGDFNLKGMEVDKKF
jgi:hypothetical protein